MNATDIFAAAVRRWQTDDPTIRLSTTYHLPVVEDVRGPVPLISQTRKRKSRARVYWKGAKLSRVPTEFERRVVALNEIVDTLEQQTAQTIATIEAARVALVPTLDAGDIYLGLNLSAIEPVDQATWEALVQMQVALARYGAEQVDAERARQGGRARPASDFNLDTLGPLVRSTETACGRLFRTWRTSLQHLSQRLRRAKRRTPTTVQEMWTARALAAAGEGVTPAVHSLANEAFAFGRLARLRSSTVHLADSDLGDQVDYYLYTAILDANTCDPCAALDGTVLSEDELDDYTPPYVDCDGGDRCRCQILAVVGDWRDKADVEDALGSDRIAAVTEKQGAGIVERRQRHADELDNED